MNSNFIIAQIFGVIGIIFSVLSMQMKTKKNIMIMLLWLNFLFLNSISGSLVCFFAVFETFLNYLFDSKNNKVPIYVIAFYVVVNLVLGFSTYNSLLDLIPIVCALIYCATICTKKESIIRKEMFVNQTLWLIYDIIVKAYMFSISNILTLISIVISMIRYDYKKKK